MTVADCVTRVLEQSEVRKRIVKVSRQLRAGLDNVQLVSAGVLQKVRGVGLLLGVQISDAYQRDRELWGAAAFREELVRQGVLCHVAAGDPSVLLLLPPFTISEEEVGVAVAAFSAAASV
jgi:acetylornithine/succinyldiaminopimelate/putrescine aminotransferase